MHSYLSSTRALTPGHSIIHDSALPVTMQSSESAARIGHLAQMLLIFEAADGNRIELQGVIAMSASELATLSRKSMAPSPLDRKLVKDGNIKREGTAASKLRRLFWLWSSLA